MDRSSPLSTSSADSTFQPAEHELAFDNITNDFIQNMEDIDDGHQPRKKQKHEDEEEKKPFVRKSSSKRKSYNLLNIQQAYKVYDEYKAANVKDLQKSVSNHLNVPQGTFAGWLKFREQNEEKIRNATEKQLLQFQGKGNCQQPFYPEEEAKLRDIILARRANNEPCGGDFIRATMMKLVEAGNHKEKAFNASHNWLTRFSSRMNVPNRKGPIPGTLKINVAHHSMISKSSSPNDRFSSDLTDIGATVSLAHDREASLLDTSTEIGKNRRD